MKKINSGYSYVCATADQVEALADEMDQMVKRYGWQDRTTMPWPGVKMTVAEITKNMREYRNCTKGSKLYLIDLANGLVDIMNAWEQQELEPKLTIRLLNSGKVRQVGMELANELIAEGHAVAV